MLDKLDDLLSTIKERLRSPLVSSFLISWIIINWKIVIGLIWFKSEQLHEAGYKTYFDLVSSNIEIHKNLYYPLIVAIGYTFVFPFIRNVINAFLSWINKWGDNWNLSIRKDGSVPIARYIKLKGRLDETTQQVEEVINEATVSIEQQESLQLELNEVKNSLNQKSREVIEGRRRLDSFLLNGSWQISYNKISITINKGPTMAISKDNRKDDVVEFNNGNYDLYDTKNQRRTIADIKYFQFNPNTHEVFFVKNFRDYFLEENKEHERSLVNVLVISPTFDSMTGTEGKDRVTYKKLNQ